MAEVVTFNGSFEELFFYLLGYGSFTVHALAGEVEGVFVGRIGDADGISKEDVGLRNLDIVFGELYLGARLSPLTLMVIGWINIFDLHNRLAFIADKLHSFIVF